MLFFYKIFKQMIANKPIQHSISLIHFTISVFCLSIFILYLFKEAKWSLNSLINEKVGVLIILLGVIGLFSFFGALSWQTIISQTAKKISSLIGLLFVIEYITIFFLGSKSKEFIIALTPTLTPAVFLFLLAFSKITQFQQTNREEYNDFLDSDFLISKQDLPTSIFWKPNRIVSFTSFIFSILFFPALMVLGTPLWTVSIPITFLVLCVILWLLPKIGSWSFSVLSVLGGVGLIGLFAFLLITKPINSPKDKIYIIGIISLLVLSIASLGLGLAMFLLSKEAQQEWKK